MLELEIKNRERLCGIEWKLTAGNIK